MRMQPTLLVVEQLRIPPPPKLPQERFASAFHRVDLLVCVALILVFGLVGVAAFSHGERDVRLAKCRNNLRELHKASAAYGMDHDGNTPPAATSFSGLWPWDFSRATADELVGLGARVADFYCPFLPYSNQPDPYWEFGTNFRVLGYVFVTEGAPRIPTRDAIWVGPPQMFIRVPQVATNYSMANPESLPYIVEATLSFGANAADREVNQYTGIVGGFEELPHRPSHMRGGLPEGGNLMMLDGHLEWRGFEKMKVRSTSNDTYLMPAFWW